MSRAFEYTCACFLLSTQAAVALDVRDAEQQRPTPLAYVRRVAMPRVAVRVRDLAAKGTVRAPGAGTSEAMQALCGRASEMLDAAVRKGLTHLSGCTVVEDVPLVVWPEETGAGGSRSVAVPPRAMSRPGSSDAVLAVAIDRFGARSPLYREIWFRAVAYVIMDGTGEIRGPVYAVGMGRSAPRFVRAGFMRTDEEILKEAVAHASTRLIRGLDKGDAPLFSAEVRVGVAPVRAPEYAELREAQGGLGARIPVPALKRRVDVLFNPDVGPVAVTLPASDMADALAASAIRAEDLWDGASPRLATALEVGRRLELDYLFLGAVRSASVGRFIAEDGTDSIGDVAEVMAVTALIDVRLGTVLWRAERTGSARSHIVTPEGARRIRNHEQCVMDAAVAAFAYTRFALEEWMRRRRN